MTFSKEYNLRT